MNLKLIVQVSISLLLARWKQTLVAAVGVTFSIAMFITLLGFMNGLNDLLDGLIMNRTAHIRLYHDINVSKNQPIDLLSPNTSNFINSVKPKNQRLELYNSAQIMQAIKQDVRVLGVAPKINAQVNSAVELLFESNWTPWPAVKPVESALIDKDETDAVLIDMAVQVLNPTRYWLTEEYVIEGLALIEHTRGIWKNP